MGVTSSDCFLSTLRRYAANVLKMSQEHVERISYEVRKYYVIMAVPTGPTTPRVSSQTLLRKKTKD